MRAKSANSVELDPYVAGLQLGEQLREIEPEFVIIFSSIHYDFADQYAGICDGLGRGDVLVFGGTGDGFFETSAGSKIGVAALGINSGGAMKVRCRVEVGLKDGSREAANRCAKALVEAAGDDDLRLAMVLFDALAAADNRVIDGVNEVLDCAVFGGAVADDRKLENCYVLLNGTSYQDAVGILGFSGRFSFAVDVENGSCPVSDTGVVEAASGNTLTTISGQPAMDFIAGQLGKDPAELTDFDIGVVAVQCSDHADMSDSQFRSIASWQRENGALETFGPVATGQHVRVALPTGDELISGVASLVDRLDEANLGFTPAAAFGVSCAGRQWLLGPRYEEEIQCIRARARAGLPVIGFPSLGEVGPRRRADGTYSKNLFHNVSFVFAVLGAADPRQELAESAK